VREQIRRRLALELGRIEKQGPRRVALTYPSPYTVGMSSLGFQQIYRLLSALPGVACERVFLPDGADRPGPVELDPPLSYETLTPLSGFPVIALSVAYELELMGLVRLLTGAGIPRLARERDHRHPFIIAGGPLTFSNPLPLSPFVDAIVMGEAEGVVQWAVETLFEASSREAALEALAQHPNVFVPSLHGTQLPALGRATDEHLPATSVIRTPDTELSNMFLIEAERGCSRTCTYCVMRRATDGGMRRVSKEVILEKVPSDAPKVGLVGAAVSDHPQIVEIVDELSARGKEVGLSSLRPDRLKEPFVFALKRAGYRTLTTALDGGSERLREMIERRGREPHYEAAAEHARAAGMQRMKLYLMVGLPSETDEDMDECAAFVSMLSRRIPISLGIAPFCAKRRTPLDAQPFAGIDVVQRRLERLRRGLKGRAEVRATSAKWAWVEYVMAQGDAEEGLALLRATDTGGNFADYRREFEALGYGARGEQQPRLPSPGTVCATPVRRLRKSASDTGDKPLVVLG
jgi:radical SAM superfamily enzyme YgiQ (UPF0313 family)